MVPTQEDGDVAPEVQEQVKKVVRSADGTPIAYWCSGQGRPLVLVHGTSADHTRWRTVLHLFEPHVTTCAMDRRGRGGSGDTEPYALEREFEDIAAVVDAAADEAGEPVDLFGHSHGASCALEAAVLTSSVRRLVLYEPPLTFFPDHAVSEVIERLEKLLAEGRPEAVVETFFREIAQASDDDLEVLKSLPAWQSRVAAAHTIVREERVGLEYRFDASRFSALDVPTLFLVGSESPEFLRTSSAATADAVGNSEIAVLQGQQHVAMDTAPQLLADTVLGFLTR
jgi:pimeloyl-ACP methyl ester carboxylesterase